MFHDPVIVRMHDGTGAPMNCAVPGMPWAGGRRDGRRAELFGGRGCAQQGGPGKMLAQLPSDKGRDGAPARQPRRGLAHRQVGQKELRRRLQLRGRRRGRAHRVRPLPVDHIAHDEASPGRVRHNRRRRRREEARLRRVRRDLDARSGHAGGCRDCAGHLSHRLMRLQSREPQVSRRSARALARCRLLRTSKAPEHLQRRGGVTDHTASVTAKRGTETERLKGDAPRLSTHSPAAQRH